MMTLDNMVFLTVSSTIFATMFFWAFKTLPCEGWQMFAAIPVRKTGDGSWDGVNLTFYGFFNATACALATAFLIILLGSAAIGGWMMFATVALVLGVAVPAARIINNIVEKKKYGFTVGGASFAGMLAAPPVIWMVSRSSFFTGDNSNVGIRMLAGLAIAYAFGEGFGRLACISFGCCYGEPVENTHPLVRGFFRKHNFVFKGRERKIAYAGNCEGVKVVPVQALTSIVFTISGLAGTTLFLAGQYRFAFLFVLMTTQLWRFFSEFLRADYRGGGRLSAYQIMALTTCLYGVSTAFLFPDAITGSLRVSAGLAAIWNPLAIIGIQSLWVLIFFWTGRSQVTNSRLSFHVCAGS